jgi:hypothetical protein
MSLPADLCKHPAHSTLIAIIVAPTHGDWTCPVGTAQTEGIVAPSSDMLIGQHMMNSLCKNRTISQNQHAVHARKPRLVTHNVS